jgi:hypothetical protein
MSNLRNFVWKNVSGIEIPGSIMYTWMCSFGTYHLIVEPMRDFWFWEFYHTHDRLAWGHKPTLKAAQEKCENLWLEYLKNNPESDEMHLVGLNRNEIYEDTVELYRWSDNASHWCNIYAELKIGKSWNGKWAYQVNIAGPRGSGEMGPLTVYFAKAESRVEMLRVGKDKLKERCAAHMPPEMATKAYDAVTAQIEDNAQLDLFGEDMFIGYDHGGTR